MLRVVSACMRVGRESRAQRMTRIGFWRGAESGGRAGSVPVSLRIRPQLTPRQNEVKPREEGVLQASRLTWGLGEREIRGDAGTMDEHLASEPAALDA